MVVEAVGQRVNYDGRVAELAEEEEVQRQQLAMMEAVAAAAVAVAVAVVAAAVGVVAHCEFGWALATLPTAPQLTPGWAASQDSLLALQMIYYDYLSTGLPHYEAPLREQVPARA